MATKIVSDLHSADEALRREVDPSDTLLLLGDLVNIIDYSDLDGVLVEVFGEDAVRQVVSLRGEGRIEEAREVMAKRREGREAEVWEQLRDLVSREYSRVKLALPERTYLILGNVDWPAMVDLVIGPGVELVDGKVVEIEGKRVGFLGGGLPTPLGVAGEITEEEYDAKVDGLGDVDVVCSHIPPDVPELTYDTLAGRSERGSSRLLRYVREVQPDSVYFGHIHQPLISSMHIGRTHLLNVGYFRRTEKAISFR